MVSEALAALEAELAAWISAGRRPSFWWRDDDAAMPNAKLDRLLTIAEETGVPVALAVVPDRTGPALAELLDRRKGRSIVLQHGYAHTDHARPGEKKAEFTAHRPAAAMQAEIAAGRAILQDLFAGRLQPLFVPPWNRFPDAMLPLLPALGLSGISTYGPRPQREPVPGLMRFNTHVDPIDWKNGRAYLGDEAFFAAVTTHLSARRSGTADPEEPTGILTHHEVFTEASFEALGHLLALLARHGR